MMRHTISYSEAARNIAKLSAAFAVADLMDVGGNYAGNIMLTKQGPQYLPAEALMSSYQTLLFAFSIGALYSTGILMGESIGENNKARLGLIFQQSIMYAALLSLPIGLMMYFSGSVLQSFGQSESLSLIAQSYFRSYVIGLPAILGMIGIQQFALSIHKPAVVVTTSLIYLLMCAGLSYVLIYGKLGFPALNEMGLGYANSITAYVNFLIFLAYFYFNNDLKEYQLFNSYTWRERANELSQLVSRGVNIGFQMGLEVGTVFGMTAIIGSYQNENYLSATQITLQYLFLLFIPLFSIGQSTGILCGEANKAARLDNLRVYGNASHIIAATSALVLFGLIALFNTQLIDFFSPANAEVVTICRDAMLIMAAGQVFDAMRNASTGGMRGKGETKSATVSGIGSLTVIGLGGGYLLSRSMGIQGVFLARGIALMLSSLYMLYRWCTYVPQPDVAAEVTDALLPPGDELSDPEAGLENVGAQQASMNP